MSGIQLPMIEVSTFNGNRPFAVGGVLTSVVRALLPFRHVGEPRCPIVGSCTMKWSKAAFLPGYLSSLQDAKGNAEEKKRWLEKLSVIGGVDPYETARNERLDDIDLLPSTVSRRFKIATCT